MFSPSSSPTPVNFFSGIYFFPTGIFHFCQHFLKTNIMKKKKLRGILGRKKAMRARHGKQTCFFVWPYDATVMTVVYYNDEIQTP